MIRARESKSAPVGVVGKVLKILEALDVAPGGLPLKDIAQQTSINKATAYRFLAHLETEGYLFRDAGGAYLVGPKLARLGSGNSYHSTLRKICRPVLQNLWKITRETVNLAVLDGQEVLYLDVLESPHTFRLASQIGSRRPVHSTALGKAILAHLPLEEKEDLLSSLKLERFTRHTLANPLRLKKDLLKVRRCGYALDDQEAGLGSRCVSAPIFDVTGRVAAAMSVSGPITRIARDNVPMFSRVVVDAATTVSASLGYPKT
ncbi:MAG TPA: IclR family transcriptional regulator [Candidatus Dormibacteraeota bacterium]|nr:IclR family transcriptional regulator [Candidatus Dormibacteraeota bacterium]